jgi:hypothetical protein
LFGGQFEKNDKIMVSLAIKRRIARQSLKNGGQSSVNTTIFRNIQIMAHTALIVVNQALVKAIVLNRRLD